MARATLILLGLMIGATSAAGQSAVPELYGDFRYSYNYADSGEDAFWASANNASRLGVRHEIGDRGLTAFFDLQAGVSVDADGAGRAFTQRYYLAGLRGGFGTVTVGRHSTSYKMAGLRVDPFYDTSALSAGGGVPSSGLFAGATFGLSNLTNGWSERGLAYSSPDFGGLSADAAVYLDADSDHDYNLGLAYRRSGLTVGAQYYDANGADNWAQAVGTDHALRIHASYRGDDRWTLGGSYERVELEVGPTREFLYVAGTLDATSRTSISGAVGHVTSGDAVQGVTGTGFHAGVFHRLVPRVRVNALYSWLDADIGPSRSNVSLGTSIQFSLGR